MSAAHALADHLGTDVLSIDSEASAEPDEDVLWRHAWQLDATARDGGRLPFVRKVGRLLGLPGILAPLHPGVDLSAPDRATRRLDRLIDKGLGRSLTRPLRTTGPALVTTHPALAIAAERTTKARVFCVVTSSDLPRHWAPLKGRKSEIQYMVPSRRAFDRLCAYGVLRNHIHYTGLPLHPRLLGDDGLSTARCNLSARLVRLDPERDFIEQHRDALEQRLGQLPDQAAAAPPLVTVAADGTAARRREALRAAREMLPLVDARRLRLAILSGDVGTPAKAIANELGARSIDELADLGVRIETMDPASTTSRRVIDLVGESDLLWTWPSELVFFAALGIPLLITDCNGPFEHAARRWALRRGVAKKWHPGRGCDEITNWLFEGALAEAAWSGYRKLPKRGLYRIAEIVSGENDQSLPGGHRR
jgi:hypothetical protein